MIDDLLTSASADDYRKVAVDDLRPGMYIHDLLVGWMSHHFWRQRFMLRNQADIDRLRHEGLREVVIDIRRGLPPTLADRAAEAHRLATDEARDRRLAELAKQRAVRLRDSVSLEEERWRIGFLRKEMLDSVSQLFDDIRAGRRLDIESTEPMIDKMMRSIMRQPDALIPLLQLKDHDGYSYQHSVSVAAMVIALGHTLGMSEDTLMQVAQGALLQDVGKMYIPDHILSKSGKLTSDEFDCVRSHVHDSGIILHELRNVSDLALSVVDQHHERIDGSGYPHSLTGDAISLHAQAAAIVDVYDAMISDRPYQHRLEPAAALGKLLKSAGGNFSAELVHALVRTFGVYPVGSLVRLDNGFLAVVVEVRREALLKPVVNMFYDTRSRRYVEPMRIDLAHRLEPPTILGFDSAERWGIKIRSRDFF